MVDRGWVDAVDVAAGVAVVDDSDGAASGGVSFFTAGAGDSDCSVEPDTDGAGVDDDLVSDAAGVAGGRADGGCSVQCGDDNRERRRWTLVWRR